MMIFGNALKTWPAEYKSAKGLRDQKRSKYEIIQKRRSDLFNEAFMHVQVCIGDIYSDMTRSENFPKGGSATLTLESTTEPYLRGIEKNYFILFLFIIGNPKYFFRFLLKMECSKV